MPNHSSEVEEGGPVATDGRLAVNHKQSNEETNVVNHKASVDRLQVLLAIGSAVDLVVIVVAVNILS